MRTQRGRLVLRPIHIDLRTVAVAFTFVFGALASTFTVLAYVRPPSSTTPATAYVVVTPTVRSVANATPDAPRLAQPSATVTADITAPTPALVSVASELGAPPSSRSERGVPESHLSAQVTATAGNMIGEPVGSSSIQPPAPTVPQAATPQPPESNSPPAVAPPVTRTATAEPQPTPTTPAQPTPTPPSGASSCNQSNTTTTINDVTVTGSPANVTIVNTGPSNQCTVPGG